MKTQKKKKTWYELKAGKFIEEVERLEKVSEQYHELTPEMRKDIVEHATSDFYVYGSPKIETKIDKKTGKISVNVEIPRKRVPRRFIIDLNINQNKEAKNG